MKQKRIMLCAIFLFCLGIFGLQAQESINTTGGEHTGSSGSVSYSIGQLTYTTKAGTNGSVAEGVQQAYEISIVSGIEEVKDIILSCTAYPNPTTDYLTLEVDNYELSRLNFQLLDITGKLIESKTIENNETKITMSNLAPSTYFLKVVDHQKEVKTFKIIKTN